MIDSTDKTRLNKHQIGLQDRGRLPVEPWELQWVGDKDEPPQTACWSFEGGRHRIQFNVHVEDAVRLVDKRARVRRKFLAKVLEHEDAHARFTTREHLDLAKKLDGKGIPFVIWNIFEDARIEANWRKFYGKFGWPQFSDEFPSTPENMMITLIRTENSRAKINAWLKEDRSKDEPKSVHWLGEEENQLWQTRELVVWFYRAAIKCKSSDGDLVDLIEKWVKCFPPAIRTITVPDWFMDLIKALVDAVAREALKETPPDEVAKPVKRDEKDYEPECGAGPLPITRPDDDPKYEPPPKLPKSKYFSEEKTVELNRLRGDRLVSIFDKFLRGGETRSATSTPSSRMDFKRLLGGSDRFYLRRSDESHGMKKINIIYDTSGSMHTPHGEGAYFLYIMNELVRRKKVICNKLILSGGKSIAVPMPFDWRFCEHIKCCGSIEGFAHAMRQNERDLVEADLTIFFTDGNITDEKIDKNDWHRKGVYSIGLYAVPNVADSAFAKARVEEMHKYFDQVLVRPSIELLADGLLQILRK